MHLWHLDRALNLWQECDADVVIASDSDLWPYLGVLIISRLLSDFVTDFLELLGGRKS